MQVLEGSFAYCFSEMPRQLFVQGMVLSCLLLRNVLVAQFLFVTAWSSIGFGNGTVTDKRRSVHRMKHVAYWDVRFGLRKLSKEE